MKTFGLVAHSAVCLILLAGCHKPTKELHIVGEALPPLQSLGELAKEYEKTHGVRLAVHPYEFETALQRAQMDFVSGSGQYDLVMGIFYNHGKYYEAGYVTNLGTLGKSLGETNPVSPDDFYKPLQDLAVFYKGDQIGYPFSAQTMFLWYRKDIFSHADERRDFQTKYGYELPLPDEQHPLTWDQFKDIAEFFTRPKGAKLGGEVLQNPFYGLTLQLKRHPCSIYEFSNFIYSFGGGVKNGEGKYVLNSKENVAALEYYLSLQKYAPPGVTQFTWDDALAQMQQGLIAMTIMWSDAPSDLYDATKSKVGGKIGYSLVPVHSKIGRKVSVYGGWSFLINSKSKNQAEAYRFIQWACSYDVQRKWAKVGGLPATKRLFEDPEYLAVPYMKAQNEALKNLVAWPRTPGAELFVSKGQLALGRAASGELTAEQALNWLQQELEK